MKSHAQRTSSAVLISALASAAFFVSACRGEPPNEEAAASFSFDNVRTESSQLALSAATVRGVLHRGYIDWACVVRCQDPAGCSADLQVTIHFTSNGEEKVITFAGPIDVPVGARARVGGVQRPARPVDRVDFVVIEAKPRRQPGAPLPTPRI